MINLHQRIFKKCPRRKVLACLTLALIIAASFVGYARRARQAASDQFGLAADVPRGALVYVQCESLRELLKTWNESKFKDDYLASQNFKEFARRHLALRLLERWETANDALGFTLDADALSGVSEGRAALALYDIGRLEMVLVAPLSLERAKATQFFSDHKNFDEAKLPDGTKYFRREISDDNKKPLTVVFAAAQDRFILATNERLLLRTLANINSHATKDRLADEPDFNALTRAAQTHFLTVWVNQQKLNDDSYFRRYWAFANVNDFKAMRAAIFDLERRQDKWIERREFLRETTNAGDATADASISPAVADRLARFAIADAPYYGLCAVGEPSQIVALISETLFDRAAKNRKRHAPSWNWRPYSEADFDLNISNEADNRRESRYTYLGEGYDMQINDPNDARDGEDGDSQASDAPDAENEFIAALQKTLQPAAPQAAMLIENPQTFAPPLFAEFRRATVLALRSPETFNRADFENALTKYAAHRVMVAGGRSSAVVAWRDVEMNGVKIRAAELPLLGWTLCYALRNQDLVVANSAELLRALIANADNAPRSGSLFEARASAPLNELTVIRFDKRAQVFDALVERLDKPRRRAEGRDRDAKTRSVEDEAEADFFSGNVKSLLDAASFISEIKIARQAQRESIYETVELRIKNKAD